LALHRLPRLGDDGLALPDVGEWGETKYRIIANICEMFATSMKDKWDARVYIDLFAAAGRARIRGRQFIVPTSAMLALQVRNPFDRYIFCEIDSSLMSALEARVRRDVPGRDARFVLGDCNASVGRILSETPTPSRNHTVLTFCVADPKGLINLKFSTIAALAERFVDFLVLIPSSMDARRFGPLYFDQANAILDDFLGDSTWRDRWGEVAAGPGPHDFGAFVVDRFGLAMKELGFLYPGPHDTVPVKDKHLLLYHLAFFSRRDVGRKFWLEARRLGIDQLSFSLGLE
jgi:three-Cys-motif partner protein